MGSDKKSKSGSNEQVLETKIVIKRRKFLAGMTASAAAAGMTSGGKWVKPVVDSVVLPVHAQTSGLADMRLQGRVAGNDFGGIVGTVFTDGNYPVTADHADFDDFIVDFSALFQPVQAQSVSVNLDVTADTVGSGDVDFDGGALSQTSSANVPVDAAMRANFTAIEFDANDDHTADSVTTIAGTIRAQGYATRRITYVITT